MSDLPGRTHSQDDPDRVVPVECWEYSIRLDYDVPDILRDLADALDGKGALLSLIVTGNDYVQATVDVGDPDDQS